MVKNKPVYQHPDLKIAVVGATGNVGRCMLSILAERGFPLKNISAVASERSAGGEVSYGEEGVLRVKALSTFDFTGTQVALFSPGGKVSAEFAPKAVAQGCVVIDNTSHFRMDEDVPLIVPEVNGDVLADFKTKKPMIIANPNCSTIQLLMALKPLHSVSKIKRVVVSTYQSVSGAGKDAMDELYSQTKSIFGSASSGKVGKFPRPIAFNVIPQIDVFMEDGDTKEEWKMIVETKKILDPSIELTATCVRVPVFIGHAVSANVEFHKALSLEKARSVLLKAPGIVVKDTEDYTTPVECTGSDFVYVSRIRQDKSIPHGLNLWIVADNVRKGAALNAVQILELLAEQGALESI